MEKIKKLGSNRFEYKYRNQKKKVHIIPKKNSLKIRKLKFNSIRQVKKHI